MNEQQFLEMDDRERDAWITNNLMGGKKEAWYFVDGSPDGRKELQDYRYSTDYNAMMRVIEKMAEIDPPGLFTLEQDYLKGYFWSVLLWCGKKEFVAKHESLPLAVYLAAGRAKGVIE